MSEPLSGRDLLAIRARTTRAADGQRQSLAQTEQDRAALLNEVYRLRETAVVNGALHRSAEGEVTAVHALVARWEQGVTWLHVANEHEASTATRQLRAIKADAYEQCIRELRDALAAPTPREKTR